MGGFATKLLEKAGASGIGDALGKGLQSGEYSLKKQGPVSGLLANLLREFETTSTRESANAIQPLIQDAEYVASDALRHAEYYQQRTTGKLATDPRVAKFASSISNVVDSVYSKHAQAGYKVAPRVKGPYFPDSYPREVFEPGTKENQRAIDLIVSQRGKTVAQAHKILDSFNPNQFKNPLTAPFHHIESSRTLHLPELARKDVAVDLEYIVGGIKRLNEKRIFGETGEKTSLLLKAIRAESGTPGYNFARGVFSTFMGHNSDAYVKTAERELQSFEIATHLGLAVFSHPAKTIESAFVGGLSAFARAINDLATNKEEFFEFGHRSGAALNDTLHEIRRIAKVENEGLGSKTLRATQFMRVINFQEMLHANVGKHAALSEFASLLEDSSNTKARIRLQTLGIDVDQALERGQLNEEDLQRAGYKMAKIVLGGRTVLDLPPVWRDNWCGRLLTLFKPFFFNQSKFIKDHIIKPALHGDTRALIYASIIYPAVGEIVADIKTAVRGKSQDERPDWDKYPYDRIVDNISQVGGFGIASDVINSLTTATPTTTYQLLTGPIVGDLVDAVSLLHGSWEQRERAILRRIPTVGPALSRHLAPPKHRRKGALESGVVTRHIEKGVKAFTQ